MTFYLFGLLPVLYVALVLGTIWERDMTLTKLVSAMEEYGRNPISLCITSYTLPCLMACIAAYGLYVLWKVTDTRTFQPGREYGSARFEIPKQISKKLEDKGGSNRLLTRQVKISLNTRKTGINNNLLVIGGSGAGKSLFLIKPNIMEMNGSLVCSDVKGELLSSAVPYLKTHGYQIKVLNFVEMERSDGYNPIAYIRDETDVIKLITNLIKNTTPKGSNSSDPFWERAEALLLQALIYYIWMEEPKERKNLNRVVELLAEAQVNENGEMSDLDIRMSYLEKTNPKGSEHPAVRQYKRAMGGAADTVRSILISANSRLAFLENEKIKRILERDEMDLPQLGTGVNEDKRTKTALFVVTPDSDKSYAFLVGILYTQLLQELYYQADINYGGRLPIPVTMYLDEFYNTPLPDSYLNFLSTMRSRQISNVIVIQSISQLKEMYKDSWETVTGNCDTLLYLGGNEQGSHKYISELMGKASIYKKSEGQSKGRNGSSSTNTDVIGRELMTSEEVRKMDKDYCLLFIRGYFPIIDKKIDTFHHPMWPQSGDGGALPYVHQPYKASRGASILNKDAQKAMEMKQKAGMQVDVIHTSDKEILKTEENTAKKFLSQKELIQNRKENQMPEQTEIPELIQKKLDELGLDENQKFEILEGIKAGLPEENILEYMKPYFTAEMMREIRETILL